MNIVLQTSSRKLGHESFVSFNFYILRFQKMEKKSIENSHK